MSRTILVREILGNDTRLADWWISADLSEVKDVSNMTLSEAKEHLLSKCDTDEKREEILAGSVELANAPRFYEWTVKIRVSHVWVADGFDLDARRLRDMVMSDLNLAACDEIETEIVEAPDPKEIRMERDDSD